MNSISFAKNKNVSKNFQYNFQHIVFVSKYRYKVFKNPMTQKIIAEAFREVEMQYGIAIKEFSFGDDFAHVHMEINIPNKFSIAQAVQILKSHSSSKIFKEMPNFIKKYPHKTFWGGQYSNSSVGFATEDKIKQYIRKQDVSFESFIRSRELPETGRQAKLQFN